MNCESIVVKEINKFGLIKIDKSSSELSDHFKNMVDELKNMI